jgi:hypothetical protein
MPPPSKPIKVTRTGPEFTFTTLDEHLKRVKLAKELIKELIRQRDEADRQREEDGREQREIDERRRLDEEFNEWWEKKQTNDASREQPKQPTREQSSKNQELMAASLTLGIPIYSNMRNIKQAYRRLARQTHPDRSNDPDATAKFQKLLEAYDILSAHQRMSKNGGNKCRNRRTSHHRPKKTQTHRHTTHHRKTHRVRV